MQVLLEARVQLASQDLQGWLASQGQQDPLVGQGHWEIPAPLAQQALLVLLDLLEQLDSQGELGEQGQRAQPASQAQRGCLATLGRREVLGMLEKQAPRDQVEALDLRELLVVQVGKEAQDPLAPLAQVATRGALA